MMQQQALMILAPDGLVVLPLEVKVLEAPAGHAAQGSLLQPPVCSTASFCPHKAPVPHSSHSSLTQYQTYILAGMHPHSTYCHRISCLVLLDSLNMYPQCCSLKIPIGWDRKRGGGGEWGRHTTCGQMMMLVLMPNFQHGGISWLVRTGKLLSIIALAAYANSIRLETVLTRRL